MLERNMNDDEYGVDDGDVYSTDLLQELLLQAQELLLQEKELQLQELLLLQEVVEELKEEEEVVEEQSIPD